MAQVPYRNAYLTNIGTIAQSGGTLSLGAFEIGIFDARTYQAVTAPSYPTTNAIIIAQGRDPQTFPMGVYQSNESFKTQIIKAPNIVSLSASASQRPQNMIVTLGFDGVDTSKTLSYPANKDLNVYLTMSGAPVGNLLGASSTTSYNTYTEVFTPVMPCLDDCVDNCSATVDCNALADALILEINKRKTIGGELLSKYVKATKVVSCDTPSGYVTTSCVKWSITICDVGGQVGLGMVQAQYPSYTVTRVSREASLSTYELVVCGGDTPAAYDLSVSPTIPNCTTCPSGYTLVDGLYSYTVTRTDAGTAAALATFKANYAATTEEATAVRLSYALGTSTYQIFSTSSTLSPPLVAPGDVVTLIGSVQGICVIDSATTQPWVEGSSCTKAEQTYQVSLKNNLCGDGFLTELEAAYPSGTVTQGITNEDNCTTIYYLTILSDNYNCDTCNVRGYDWAYPSPFNGSIWTLSAVSHTGTGCVCGVKFESAYVQRDRAECYFSEVSYEVEPLFITVSTINPNSQDYSSLCEERIPVTVVQGIKYAKGYGSSVLSERVKLSNFYFGKNWKTDPAERNAMGLELGIDLQGYYDEVAVEYYVDTTSAGSMSGFGQSQRELHCDTWYFPAGSATDFINALNAFVSYPGSLVSPITI